MSLAGPPPGGPLLDCRDPMTSQHQFQFPTPPVQTPVQASVRAASERAAAAASAAATPRVLELFASPELRRLLSACCPAAAKLSPERLLDRVRAEAKAAEIVHNFPARPAGEFVDVSMASLEKYGFFLNQWQAQLIPPAEAPPEASPVWTPGAFDPRSTAANASSAHYKNLGPQIAEISIFGCPPFARPLRPTWDEAANRLVYAAHNIRRLDTGSAPLFGNVGAVFRTSRVRKMVEIAPIDTGIWEASCNDTYGPPRFNLDCSYPMAPVGTLDHFDHVLYRGLGSWGGDGSRGGRLPRRSLAQSAAELIARSAVGSPSYRDAPNATELSAGSYWEANLLGNPRPDDIKLVLPFFGALFGSADGARLRRLADSHGWPVVWALGDGGNGTAPPPHGALSGTAYPGNRRLLDPTTRTAQRRLNASLPPGSAASFERAWAAAAGDRRAGPVSRAQVQRWWAGLEGVRLAPVAAAACADTDGCVGVVVDTGACVCERVLVEAASV